MVNQIVAARRGKVTEEVRQVAHDEGISAEKLRGDIANGRAVIMYNGLKDSKPLGIGEGLRTKVNANIGNSPDICDLNLELEKAKVAIRYGADTIMDLSTEGDLDLIRNTILKEVRIPLGTVPIYQAYIETIRKYKSPVRMDVDYLFNAIEKHMRDGVAFMTVHCGITLDAVKYIMDHPRLNGIVSRGGAFLAAWMLHHEKENPLYSDYDYILELANKYDVTLSLGDGLRPGSLADSSDYAQFHEALTISKLVKRAWKAGVQVIVEGPGHLPLDQIEANVKIEKTLCNGAPFYLLGPLVTDIASGYDHIAGAIGGAIAAMVGADYLCYVTPAEHLGLPNVEDVRQGVIASKIAAHAADIVKLGERAMKHDLEISEARSLLDWKSQINLSVDPDRAKEIHYRKKSKSGTCTMCGDWCTYKIIERVSRKKREKVSTVGL
ncbi:MAG: phosphomethylpyrimidine synthase ThiC [Candidatus Methylarchaceae archaeon HK02M1]|nr:phosphomethylpyrimidine synthase ThiC [Candidatus Methylarchaceae archaeon HK02M1]